MGGACAQLSRKQLWGPVGHGGEILIQLSEICPFYLFISLGKSPLLLNDPGPNTPCRRPSLPGTRGSRRAGMSCWTHVLLDTCPAAPTPVGPTRCFPEAPLEDPAPAPPQGPARSGAGWGPHFPCTQPTGTAKVWAPTGCCPQMEGSCSSPAPHQPTSNPSLVPGRSHPWSCM